MTTVGAYEAKTHLPRILAEVMRGEVVTITRHGVPIARLVPAAAAPSQAGDGSEHGGLLERFRAARTGVVLGDASVAEMIDDGRR